MNILLLVFIMFLGICSQASELYIGVEEHPELTEEIKANIAAALAARIQQTNPQESLEVSDGMRHSQFLETSAQDSSEDKTNVRKIRFNVRFEVSNVAVEKLPPPYQDWPIDARILSIPIGIEVATAHGVIRTAAMLAGPKAISADASVDPLMAFSKLRSFRLQPTVSYKWFAIQGSNFNAQTEGNYYRRTARGLLYGVRGLGERFDVYVMSGKQTWKEYYTIVPFPRKTFEPAEKGGTQRDRLTLTFGLNWRFY